MATSLKTVAGNTAPPLLITCERAGAVIDLTSATSVTLKIKGRTGITQTGRAAAITTAVAGLVTYTPLTTDFPTAGSYKGDLKITYADASFEILYEQLKMKARAPLS